MAEFFFGNWTVTVQAVNTVGAFSQRFIIDGSRASDGVYSGQTTNPPLAVSGESWAIRFEFEAPPDSLPGTFLWKENVSRRSSVAYTLQDGLVVLVGSQKIPSVVGHDEFDGILLRCSNLDTKLNPWRPFTNPYDFTLPMRLPPRR